MMQKLWTHRSLLWEQGYPAAASVILTAICVPGKPVSFLEALVITGLALIFALREDLCWHALHRKHQKFIQKVWQTRSYHWLAHMHNRVFWMGAGTILEFVFLAVVHNMEADFAVTMIQTAWLLFVFLTILYGQQMINICWDVDRA